MSDQFARWRHALEDGTRVEWERGDVASGFYKRDAGTNAPKSIEAICIYRDDTGKLQCIRDVYGDGSRMDADQIEELFASCCHYAIPEDVYRAVTERNESWPPEYATRLSLREVKDGVAWTPELGRKKLGPAHDAAENPRAIIGGNNPPEPTETVGGHTITGERTPDKVLFAKVSAAAAEVKRWLADIGGAPRDKAEADKIADYATLFKAMAKDGETQRKAEKQPILDAERDIDARWKAPVSAAETARKAALAHVDRFLAAENKRREEEARAANEAAKASGASSPPPAEPERINSVGNMRTVSSRGRTVWVVADPRAYAAHLLALEGDLPGELTEALGKIAQRRGVEAPGVTKEDRRQAA